MKKEMSLLLGILVGITLTIGVIVISASVYAFTPGNIGIEDIYNKCYDSTTVTLKIKGV